MRIIVKLEKQGDLRFVSHLDVQRLFQRALRRANVPIAYSQGFNPHPQISFATALSLGYSSNAEWLDVRTAEDVDAETLKAQVNAVLPEGMRILCAAAVPDGTPSLSALMTVGEYTVSFSGSVDTAALSRALDALLSGEILVQKRGKAGVKEIDLRPQIFYAAAEGDSEHAHLKVRGVLNAGESLNMELFMQSLRRFIELPAHRINRDEIYSKDGVMLPKLGE